MEDEEILLKCTRDWLLLCFSLACIFYILIKVL